MKLRPVGAELFHADGQTDITKLIIALRNLTRVSKKKAVTRYPYYILERSTDGG